MAPVEAGVRGSLRAVPQSRVRGGGGDPGSPAPGSSHRRPLARAALPGSAVDERRAQELARFAEVWDLPGKYGFADPVCNVIRTTMSHPDETNPSTGATTLVGSRYTVLRHHAKGAMGEVFVAADHEFDREVAFKVIRNIAPTNPQAGKSSSRRRGSPASSNIPASSRSTTWVLTRPADPFTRCG